MLSSFWIIIFLAVIVCKSHLTKLGPHIFKLSRWETLRTKVNIHVPGWRCRIQSVLVPVTNLEKHCSTLWINMLWEQQWELHQEGKGRDERSSKYRMREPIVGTGRRIPRIRGWKNSLWELGKEALIKEKSSRRSGIITSCSCLEDNQA